eukprot:6202058-Pleurochrysis_carterae.AAC.1
MTDEATLEAIRTLTHPLETSFRRGFNRGSSFKTHRFGARLAHARRDECGLARPQALSRTESLMPLVLCEEHKGWLRAS